MLVAQISDPHVTLPGRPLERQFDTSVNLERAVAHIVELATTPDVVVISGDCVDEGTVEEYERFRKLIQPLEMPVYVIPGNHDDRKNMRDTFGEQGTLHHQEFIQYVVNIGPLRIIALDTLIPNEPRGELCPSRRAWLKDRLAEDETSPTILFQHHPPFATGMVVADQIGFNNPDHLGDVVAQHSNIERILAGHVHCHIQKRFHGTIALTCPSTALQLHIDLNQDGTLSALMSTPACLLHYWSETTGLVTYTSPIGEHGPVQKIHDGKDWMEIS